MPLRIGQTDIGKIYLGSAPIAKIYVGSTLIWQQTVTPQASLMPTIAIGSGVV